MGEAIWERSNGPGGSGGDGFPHGFHAGRGYQPKPIAKLPPFQFASVYPSQDGWEGLAKDAGRVLRGHNRAGAGGWGGIRGRVASRQDGKPMRGGKVCICV